jgi:hypothetical protein
MKRTTATRLVELAAELSERDREITQTAARLRLLSGKHLERLFFEGTVNASSRARLTRRALARLVASGVLGRLERRVGGVRAGAAGHVYYAAPTGQRLVRYWRGEGAARVASRYEPTGMFVRHGLGVSESYVRLVEADRAGRLQLVGFWNEPAAWRPYIGPGGRRLLLKPDALVHVGLDEATELHTFLEVDCGSEGRRALERKCSSYVAAWRAGIGAEVFPRVVWITTSQRRAGLLREVCAGMPAEAWKLFLVTTPDRALEALTSPAAEPGSTS